MATLKQLDRATFSKVRDITHKYNVDSIFITKYLIESGQYDIATIDDKTEILIAKQAERIKHIIAKTVKQLCEYFGAMADTQVSIYRMVLNNEELCNYFLSHSPEAVMADVEASKGAGDLKLDTFLGKIAPSIDLSAELKDSSPWS